MSYVGSLNGLLGHILDMLLQFFANILGGWMLIMIILTSAIIIGLYFRFLRRTIQGGQGGYNER